MAKQVNVLALVKGEEQYLFLFDDSNRVETLRLLGRYAADPELSFSWYDAAVLSQKIRDTLSASDATALVAKGRQVPPILKNPPNPPRTRNLFATNFHRLSKNVCPSSIRSAS